MRAIIHTTLRPLNDKGWWGDGEIKLYCAFCKDEIYSQVDPDNWDTFNDYHLNDNTPICETR